jgi:hypothetical protein
VTACSELGIAPPAFPADVEAALAHVAGMRAWFDGPVRAWSEGVTPLRAPPPTSEGGSVDMRARGARGEDAPVPVATPFGRGRLARVRGAPALAPLAEVDLVGMGPGAHAVLQTECLTLVVGEAGEEGAAATAGAGGGRAHHTTGDRVGPREPRAPRPGLVGARKESGGKAPRGGVAGESPPRSGEASPRGEGASPPASPRQQKGAAAPQPPAAAKESPKPNVWKQRAALREEQL